MNRRLLFPFIAVHQLFKGESHVEGKAERTFPEPLQSGWERQWTIDSKNICLVRIASGAASGAPAGK